jgi:hypothetical protein
MRKESPASSSRSSGFEVVAKAAAIEGGEAPEVKVHHIPEQPPEHRMSRCYSLPSMPAGSGSGYFSLTPSFDREISPDTTQPTNPPPPDNGNNCERSDSGTDSQEEMETPNAPLKGASSPVGSTTSHDNANSKEMRKSETMPSDGEADGKGVDSPRSSSSSPGSLDTDARQPVCIEPVSRQVSAETDYSNIGPLIHYPESGQADPQMRLANGNAEAGRTLSGSTSTSSWSLMWNGLKRPASLRNFGTSSHASQKGQSSRLDNFITKAPSVYYDDVTLRQQIETELTRELESARRVGTGRSSSAERVAAKQRRSCEKETDFEKRLSKKLSVNSTHTSDTSLTDAPITPAPPDNTTVAAMSSPFILRVCGLLPCPRSIAIRTHDGGFLGCGSLNLSFGCRTWYQLLVLTSVLVALGFAIYQAAVPVPDELTVGLDGAESDPASSLRPRLLADIPLAIGAFIGLWQSVAVQRTRILGDFDTLLVRYAINKDTLDNWAILSKRDMWRLLAIWFGMLLDRAMTAREGFNVQFLLSFVTFAILSSVLMALLYCMSHISRALATMVDGFCLETVVTIKEQEATVQTISCKNAIITWNVFQATARKACCAIDLCFTVLFTTAMISVLVPLLMSTTEWDATIPGVLFSLAVAVVASIAGEVTSKCDRAPAMINTLSFGEDELSIERQYIVTHMGHSLAGFYILDVRLTPDMVFKTAYFSCAIGAFLITQLHN